MAGYPGLWDESHKMSGFGDEIKQRRIVQLCDQVISFAKLKITVYDEQIAEQVFNYMERLQELDRNIDYLKDETATKLNDSLNKLRKLKMHFLELKHGKSTVKASFENHHHDGSSLDENEYSRKANQVSFFTYEELCRYKFDQFDGNLFDWLSYRVQIFTMIRDNPKLTPNQRFRLVWNTLSSNVKNIITPKLNTRDVNDLIIAIFKEYSSLNKVIKVIDKVPILTDKSGIAEWSSLHKITVEVMKRFYMQYFSKAATDSIYSDLTQKLPKGDFVIFLRRHDYKQTLLEHLAKFIELRYLQIQNGFIQ